MGGQGVWFFQGPGEMGEVIPPKFIPVEIYKLSCNIQEAFIAMFSRSSQIKESGILLTSKPSVMKSLADFG